MMESRSLGPSSRNSYSTSGPVLALSSSNTTITLLCGRHAQLLVCRVGLAASLRCPAISRDRGAAGISDRTG